MNKVILMGRLTREPNVSYTQGERSIAVARFTVAVDRRFSRRDANNGEQTADFISCVAFDKQGEFAEKYLHQGTKVVVCGRIQTGSYTNREGQRVYTTDVVTEEIEFAESKNASSGANNYNAGDHQSQSPRRPQQTATPSDGFLNIPDGVEDEGLPFN